MASEPKALKRFRHIGHAYYNLYPKRHKIKISSSYDNPKSKSNNSSQAYSSITRTKKKIPIKGHKNISYSHSQANSTKNVLDETIKKNPKPKQKKYMISKSKNKYIQILDHSIDQNERRHAQTPKFGDRFEIAHNLTQSKLDFIFQLNRLHSLFDRNFTEMQLEILLRLEAPRLKLERYIAQSQSIIRQKWIIINQSCTRVTSQRDCKDIQAMLANMFEQKRKVKKLKENLQQAIELLKI